MRKYVAHTLIVIRDNLHYKFNLIFSTLGLLIMIICLRELWTALYAQNQVSQTLDLHGVLIYSTVSFIVSSFMISPFAGVVSERVKNGLIAIDLLRPWSFYGFLLSRSLGELLARLMTKTLLLIVVVTVSYGLNSNHTLNVGAFLISLIAAIFVAFNIYYLISLLAFKLTDVWGLDLLILTLFMNVFSGALIPLWIYPKFFQNIVNILPFRAMYDIPLSILVGKISNEEVMFYISLQVIWALILYCCGVIAYKLLIKRLIIAGS